MEQQQLAERLRTLADHYETPAFLDGDPSWFMHQVTEEKDKETMGFIASVFSYGSRRQFMPKIQYLLTASEGEPWRWVRDKAYRDDISDDDSCFYRLYTNRMMVGMLDALCDMLTDYGTIGQFVRRSSPNGTALEALDALSSFFRSRGIKGMVPSPASSVAKRPCMYLRWMVRSPSPVDLGLWADFIRKDTLYVPLDTHVIQMASALNLITGRTASWRTVVRLSEAMGEVFPGDPARGDFALFGYGVDADKAL